MPSGPIDQQTQLRDEELLVLMSQGDERALGTLYDRYGRLVFSIALRIIGDRLSAEEVTQDVFEIVWQQGATFRASAGSVAGWLIGITRHRAIDEIRSRRHKARQREMSTEDAPLEALNDPGNVEHQAVLRGDVRSALQELPTPQREAIEMAYYGGLTCDEIASSLGTPIGTIKTRMRLALVKLRSALLPGLETGES